MIINEEYPLKAFISRQKIRGLKFLRVNLGGLKLLLDYDLKFSKINFSLKVTEKNYRHYSIIIFELNKGCQLFLEKINGLRIIMSEKVFFIYRRYREAKGFEGKKCLFSYKFLRGNFRFILVVVR